jgi:hypothetical protein
LAEKTSEAERMIMMTDKNASDESIGGNMNAIIITAAIVVLAVIFMFFRDRQQKRKLQLQQFDTQMRVWEEWDPQQRNRQLNNTGQEVERVL